MSARFGLLAMMILFGANIGAAAAASIRLPDGPGVKLIYAKCRTCHDLQYLVDSKGLLPAQWQSLVTSMQDYGLEVSAQEKKEILEYLTTYLGPNPPPTPAKTAHKEQTTKADGHEVFAQNCASCHGAEGRGQPGYFPPLTGNPDLLKDRLFPVLVALNGLSGPIEVNGQTYNGSMPAFDYLSNAEIAAVVNFIHSAWGNEAAQPGAKRLTAADVAQQRKRAMTPSEVHEYRAKASARSTQ